MADDGDSASYIHPTDADRALIINRDIDLKVIATYTMDDRLMSWTISMSCNSESIIVISISTMVQLSFGWKFNILYAYISKTYCK